MPQANSNPGPKALSLIEFEIAPLTARPPQMVKIELKICVLFNRVFKVFCSIL